MLISKKLANQRLDAFSFCERSSGHRKPYVMNQTNKRGGVDCIVKFIDITFLKCSSHVAVDIVPQSAFQGFDDIFTELEEPLMKQKHRDPCAIHMNMVHSST